ncbi:MAG: NADPH-dependent FMN reductase [Rhizobiaceae bacterium]
MASGSEQAGGRPGEQAIRIGAICGSLRVQSTNQLLLQAFAKAAPAPVHIDTSLSLALLPLFNPDLERATPDSVSDLAERIDVCDGLLIASPEYAHGMTGVLKNALDWLVSRSEIPGKPVMLVHASARSDTSREHLREVLRTMSCHVYGGEEFVFHLIGKAPGEAAMLLDADDMRATMRETLMRFAAFVRGGGREAG